MPSPLKINDPGAETSWLVMEHFIGEANISLFISTELRTMEKTFSPGGGDGISSQLPRKVPNTTKDTANRFDIILYSRYITELKFAQALQPLTNIPKGPDKFQCPLSLQPLPLESPGYRAWILWIDLDLPTDYEWWLRSQDSFGIV